MALRGASDGFMCKAFASLLRKTVNDWYMHMELNSIRSFHKFGRKFTARFANNRLRHDPTDAFLALRQGKNESLRDFMLKFNAKLSRLTNIDVQIAVAALKYTTIDQNLKVHLTLKPPRNLQELESKTNKLIRAEEACIREQGQAGPVEKRKEDTKGAGKLRAEERSENENPIPIFERLGNAPIRTPGGKAGRRRPLESISKEPRADRMPSPIDARTSLFSLWQIEKPTPVPQQAPVSKQHRSRDRHRHSQHHRSPKREKPPRQAVAPDQPPTIAGKINIITGGAAAGGPTTAGRRAYAERVFSLEMPLKRARTDPPQEDKVTSFSSEDYKGLQVPHDDAQVIRLIISNYDAEKILVDTGSSVNVLHLGTFEEMKLGEGRLGPAEYSIYGFSGASVQVNGKIDLPVIFCMYPLQKTIMATFLVIDIPFTYSAIIERPALRDLGAIVSTPHLKMQFPTLEGIGEVCGQQMIVHRCYYASLKGSNAPAENFTIGGEDP
ncbi:uncharacterized protein LOC143863319 [Tasmannia lanceolata]|uniref:uncharacterized protein LOC143863319 n=1 Tax=Tasmannia lanceolata TaxID=3420 RepID=UPI004063E04F